MSSPVLLEVRDLRIGFEGEGGITRVVDGVSFEVPAGSTVGLVGESGAGKSVTAHAILGLLPSPPARVVGGQVLCEGVDLLHLSERKLSRYRGGRISLVFQDPATAFDPVYTVGAHLREAIRLHLKLGRRAVRERALSLLHRVGFPEPEARIDDYPHELSGGMRQRAMIAIALAADPALVIADEPTSSLDMLAAAQIVSLLGDLRRERGLSLLCISHDLSLVGGIADVIVVLYAGQVVENGPAARVLSRPRHPYTQALLRAVPPLRTTRRHRREPAGRLPAIPGSPPRMGEHIVGCRFAARCPEVHARCRSEAPLLYETEGHAARCFLREPTRTAALPPDRVEAAAEES